MNARELEDVLAVALPAARKAGALASQGYRNRPKVEHKGVIDLVTQYDRDNEDLLRAELAPLGIQVVGEERGGALDPAEPVLYIDPIDGTTNFVHGHPFWCVSIGLVHGGVPELGVVVAPSLGLEWRGYTANDGTRTAIRRSGDAEAACAVSAVASFSDSLLATGFPYDRKTSPDNNFDAFVAIKKKCQAVRRCGSAALDLCLVSDGTYEGYWERKLNAWDLAGGAAMVRAAGGDVTDYDGGPKLLPGGHVIATNGHIHGALIEALALVVASRA